MKNTITIQLTSLNSNVLDGAVMELLQAVSPAEYQHSVIEVLPALLGEDGKLLARKVVFIMTTSKVATALSKVDVPHNVSITIS